MSLERTGFIDSEGDMIYEGDMIRSSFGIQPITIEAIISYEGKEFYANIITGNKPPLQDFIDHLQTVRIVK